MIKDILKRSTAGLLSALTLLTTVPLSGAVDGGIMPLAEEDNEASSIVINVGEVYNIRWFAYHSGKLHGRYVFQCIAGRYLVCAGRCADCCKQQLWRKLWQLHVARLSRCRQDA